MMTDENGKKVDMEDFFSALMKINERLASIEASLDTFPAKFDKMEDRLEHYRDSAIEAQSKADKAIALAQTAEEDSKQAFSVANEAQDRADKAEINAENSARELQEYKDENKQNKNTNINAWVVIGTAVLSAIISVWGLIK